MNYWQDHTCLSVHLSVHLSICLSMCLSIPDCASNGVRGTTKSPGELSGSYLSIHRSIQLSLHLSIFVYISVYLSLPDCASKGVRGTAKSPGELLAGSYLCRERRLAILSRPGRVNMDFTCFRV